MKSGSTIVKIEDGSAGPMTQNTSMASISMAEPRSLASSGKVSMYTDGNVVQGTATPSESHTLIPIPEEGETG